MWEGLVALEAAVPQVFAGLAAALATQPDGWQALVESAEPESCLGADMSHLFAPLPSLASPRRVSSPSNGTADGGATFASYATISGTVPTPSLHLPPFAVHHAATVTGVMSERHGKEAAEREAEEGEEAGVLGRPQSPEGPAPSSQLSLFQVLLLMRVLCERRLMSAIRRCEQKGGSLLVLGIP